MVRKRQKYLELERLELSQESQEKFDVYVHKKSLVELQSERIEAISSQVLENLRQENDHQIDFEHFKQQQVVNKMRFREIDDYVNQQIETAVDQSLSRSLKFVEKQLNPLSAKQSEGKVPIGPQTKKLALNP